MDEEDEWLYTLIGTRPPKPVVDKGWILKAKFI